jgi:hypothetical protein
MASGHPLASLLYHILCESKQKSPSVFNFVDSAGWNICDTDIRPTGVLEKYLKFLNYYVLLLLII